ncbi:multicopper oxidase family protein [Lentzea sp. NPDC060358]|uniref:multicopper oxidase family protein n=1 Tax=Lentzea sp. NPDC060358 TaxID=3347103 RepID=UPI00364B9409
MFGPLVQTDMLLALLAMIAASIAGVRASSPLLRRWLRVTAVLVALRLVVIGLMAPGGLVLVEARLLVQLPLAVLPVLLALLARTPVTVHVAAAGVVLSGWWLFVPFGPQDAVAVLGSSVLVLLLAAGLSLGLGRWRESGTRTARLPWLGAGLVVVLALVLVVNHRANTAQAAGHDHHHGGVGVDQLTGPRDREPDVRLTMTAAEGQIRLASGLTVDGVTFNGVSPGPEIRVRKGQLVEVTLLNKDVGEGVTIHWHGVDVPNAEDGVPGVTQEAVRPGEQHVYRFVPNRAGSFWYHTHRDALQNVERGLFGSLVVEDGEKFDGVERTLFTHIWPGAAAAAFGTADKPVREAVPAGRKVLLRLVNSSQDPQVVRLAGTGFTVAAIDGNPVGGGAALGAGTDLQLAAGGRFDVAFTMPGGPVTVSLDDSAATAFSPDGSADPAMLENGTVFDPLAYGTGTAETLAHNRTYDLRLDDGFGFSQGRIGYVSSLINGRLYPAVPTLQVSEGDRVKIRIINRSMINHPMHLHGHRVRVLSRNGTPATGSPWWTDTLNVAPGQVFEVEFTADNPGIWMDHCHNFQHGANGMVMHLAYDGVSTPYAHEGSPE